MSFSFTYGTTGVFSVEPKVYIKEYSASDSVDFSAGTTFSAYETMLGDYQHVGECERESITTSTEEAGTIEGNEAGKFVLNSTGTVNFNIINMTTTNITALEGLEGTAVSVLFVNQPGESGDLLVLYPNINFTFQETTNPGEPLRGVISLVKTFKNKSSFRQYGEIPAAE